MSARCTTSLLLAALGWALAHAGVLAGLLPPAVVYLPTQHRWVAQAPSGVVAMHLYGAILTAAGGAAVGAAVGAMPGVPRWLGRAAALRALRWLVVAAATLAWAIAVVQQCADVAAA